MAEGTRLLSEYRGESSFAGSNPALSVLPKGYEVLDDGARCARPRGNPPPASGPQLALIVDRDLPHLARLGRAAAGVGQSLAGLGAEVVTGLHAVLALPE